MIDFLLPGALPGLPLNQAIHVLVPSPSPLPLISWFPALDFLISWEFLWPPGAHPMNSQAPAIDVMESWGPAIAFDFLVSWCPAVACLGASLGQPLISCSQAIDFLVARH